MSFDIPRAIAEITRIVLMTGIGVAIVILLSVLKELLLDGDQEIRHNREQGGGIAPFLSGALRGGQRGASPSRGHGVHARLEKGGRAKLEAKASAIRRGA